MDPQVSGTGSALSLVCDYAENKSFDNIVIEDHVMIKLLIWQILSGMKLLREWFVGLVRSKKGLVIPY